MFFLVFCVLGPLCLSRNGIVLSASFPSEIQFCHQSDPNFNGCIAEQMEKALKVFKDGAPEFGIPKLEPFVIPKLEIVGESNSMTQTYTNLLTYGIYISQVYNAKFVVKENECYWDFMVLTPNVYAESDYELHGQLLVFPVNGHGKCNLTITNLRNHHQASCELYKKNGNTYVRVTKYQMDISGEKIQFGFENLVPGNQLLSDQIGKAINENSQEIFKETKHGFETAWSQLHLQTCNNVLEKIPADVLYPN